MFEVIVVFLVLAYVFGLGFTVAVKTPQFHGPWYNNVVGSLLYPVNYVKAKFA